MASGAPNEAAPAAEAPAEAVEMRSPDGANAEAKATVSTTAEASSMDAAEPVHGAANDAPAVASTERTFRSAVYAWLSLYSLDGGARVGGACSDGGGGRGCVGSRG